MTFLATVTFATDTDTIRAIDAPAISGVRVDLKNADGTVVDSRVGTDPVVTFPGLAAGSYTVDAYTFDATGGVVGSVVSNSFTVGPTDIKVKTVSAIAVAITAE